MIAILLVVVIDIIGFGIIIPLLPFYAETFGASPQKVTMLMVVFSLSQFIAAPIWGSLSDKYGRRIIIWITLIGSIIFTTPSILPFGLILSLQPWPIY